MEDKKRKTEWEEKGTRYNSQEPMSSDLVSFC